MNEDEKTKEIRNACDNYVETLNALKALAHEFLWDDKARAPIKEAMVSIGRRLDTTPNNRICQSGQVTPDLVLWTCSHALLAEAKITLPRDKQVRQRQLVEIQKYDDNLVGWHTESGTVTNHDIILVVHYFHGEQVRSDIQELIESGEFLTHRVFGVIQFAVVEQSQTWLSLQLVYGSISNQDKREKFKPLPIALEHIVANERFSHIRLYDADPPLPYLMQLIHGHLLASLTRDENLTLRENGEVRKEVRIPVLKASLAAAFGPGQATERLPEIPRAKWIRDAFQLFSELKWADKVDSDEDSYLYVLKNRRNEFEQFLKICARKELARSQNGGSKEKQTSFQFMQNET